MRHTTQTDGERGVRYEAIGVGERLSRNMPNYPRLSIGGYSDARWRSSFTRGRKVTSTYVAPKEVVNELRFR